MKTGRVRFQLKRHLLCVLFVWLPLSMVLVGTSGGAVVESSGVINGGFESDESVTDAGWSWKTPGGKATLEAWSGPGDEGRAVRIRRDGDPRRWHDWILANEGRTSVKPGQKWTASARVKYEDTERIQLEILALGEERGMPGWRVGISVRYGSGGWERMQTTATIPAGYDRIYVRLCGVGEAAAKVDDVRLRQGSIDHHEETKPKVKGWAYDGERVEEELGRGVVARPREEGGVHVQWRLLESDPQDIAFNVYRAADGDSPVKLNDNPVADTTDFIDEAPPVDAKKSYFVRPVAEGDQGERSESAEVSPGAEPQAYRSIDLQGDYEFQKVGIGDLNGDGRYDFVIKQPNINIDPSYHKPADTTYKLEAYLSDGTILWRRNLGWNVITGIWYSPYIVHDFNGDGKAEVAAKTGPTDKDYRDENGRVLSGPEWVSVFDGMTGEELARADWPSRTGIGDPRLVPRNQMGVAYLDGKTPCIMPARGTYSVNKLEAYQFQDGELEKLWHWDTREEQEGVYYGQGAHQMRTADVDGDGRDETILGSCAIDDNGEGMWSIGMGHLDSIWLSDINPSREGLEMYYNICRADNAMSDPIKHGVGLVDAATGERLWGLDRQTHHVHGRGLASNIDGDVPGMECYNRAKRLDKRWIRSAAGEVIAENGEIPWNTFSPAAVYWDDDPVREVVVGERIFDYSRPNRTITGDIEGHQAAFADLYGDWREEIITSVPGKLRIYSTSISAADRRVTLMQDPLYRSSVAHMAMGYCNKPALPRNHISEK